MTEEKKYNLMIVDDHALMREGLKLVLEADPRFTVVAEANNGFSAIKIYQDIKPDLIIMDLSMPQMDGQSAIKEIKKIDPEAKILVLTVHEADEYVFSALRAGANGFILKDSDRAELIGAIIDLLNGKPYLSPNISQHVIQGYLTGKEAVKKDQPTKILTPRELEVLRCIAARLKNKDIARKLFISVKTVEKHRANIMKKLELHSSTELIAFAESAGLIES